METLAKTERTAHREESETELDVRLETTLPSQLAVGGGNAVVLWGACFHRRQRIRELRVGVPGSEAAAIAHGMPRPDVFAALHPKLELPLPAPIERDDDSEEDPYLRSYRSAFWVIAPFEPVDHPVSRELGVVARLEDGTVATASLGQIELHRDQARAPSRPGTGMHPGPLIAICMATFDPPMELFERQIESIRAQTHENWICVISDDDSRPDRSGPDATDARRRPEVRLLAVPRRLGFYRNFERALALAPREAELRDDRRPGRLLAPRQARGLLGRRSATASSPTATLGWSPRTASCLPTRTRPRVATTTPTSARC